MTADKRIVIIGAGPAGLGAAHRLRERGHENFIVYERRAKAGGLSSSFTDGEGFTWDLGGHVVFSQFEYFDRFFRRFAPDALKHDRESWIRILGGWVPYPFQNNIRHLPREAMLECLLGLVDVYAVRANSGATSGPPAHFGEWMERTFGAGICKYFMRPDNFKRWAVPAERMGVDWIAERVSVPDLRRIVENVIVERDDVSWGPNNRFRFPLRGGTGSIFENCAAPLRDKIRYGENVARISAVDRRVFLEGGASDTYDTLISTAPLDLFYESIADAPDALKRRAGRLEHNSLHVVGVGLRKKQASTMCWMYFPEDTSPFYRVTNFSNYSPNNVPGGDTETYSSLMCEVSDSLFKPVDPASVLERTIQGLLATGMMREADRDRIVSVWTAYEPYSYPIPTPGRDAILGDVLPWLESRSILSRGRFGQWRYELGNMDHSTMAGVEAADKALGEN